MKKFEMAEMEIEKFDIVDVITISGGCDEDTPVGCTLDCSSDVCPSATNWA